jgi:hypothetical protein
MTAARPAFRSDGVAARSGGGFTLPLLLALGLIAGCGDSSSSTSPPVPTGTGSIHLIPPGGCTGAPCLDNRLQNVVVSGPLTVGPFQLIFGIPSTVPFAPAGTYSVTGGTFQSSVNQTLGCPTVTIPVATGLITTVAFSITNDVCSAQTSGPA